MSEEEWRPVVGYEDLYEVSSLGRIRNMKGKVRALGTHACGYNHISLSRAGVSKTFKIHRLVAFAFIPNPEGKREVNHIDTIRTNNRVENLQWADKYENHDHSSRLGKYHAATNPRRIKKMTPELVALCRERVATGISILALSRELGLTRSNISRAINGRPSQSKRPPEQRHGLIESQTAQAPKHAQPGKDE